MQRWTAQGGGDDLRRGPKTTPRNKLTASEEQRVIAVANSPEFHDKSARQIVPTLTDRNMYIASESAFYRVMRKYGLLHHRARSRPPTSRPKALTATRPNQVYSRDITYLRTRVRGGLLLPVPRRRYLEPPHREARAALGLCGGVPRD